MKTEFELAVEAKKGNLNSRNELWEKYKKVMMSFLYKVAHLENDELVNEAFILFCHKLDLFNPEKIGVNPNKWTFSFMITGGSKNLRNKLINQSRAIMMNEVDSYDEIFSNDDLESSEQTVDHRNYLLYGGRGIYDIYNPEILAMRNLDDSLDKKTERFMNQISVFERAILVERRAGLKIREIADKMNCSISKIKNHLAHAKSIAGIMFEVKY